MILINNEDKKKNLNFIQTIQIHVNKSILLIIVELV